MCSYLLLKLSLNRPSTMMVALGCCILLLHWNLLLTTSPPPSGLSIHFCKQKFQFDLIYWKLLSIIPVLSITYSIFVVARDLESGSIGFSNKKSLVLLSNYFVVVCCACFPPYSVINLFRILFSSQNISWWMLHFALCVAKRLLSSVQPVRRPIIVPKIIK